MNILAIKAHPDDCELGCFGTLARHVYSKDEVYLLSLSSGEKSYDPETRKKEAKEAAKILGARNIFFADLPETMIHDDASTIAVIEEIIEKVSPKRIYTHTIHEKHQDHRNTAYASLSAGRYVPEILMYETPNTMENFSPQYFVDITKFIETKINAVKAHKSQMHKSYTRVASIEGLARFRGYQSGLYIGEEKVISAEAFEVARIIKKWED